MKWPIIILSGFAATASAKQNTDYPHRDWGQIVTLNMSLNDATACIAREKNRQGATLVLPVEGGNDIDWRSTTGFFGGVVSEPWETFKLRASNGITTLSVFYRHPLRLGGVTKDIARLQKRCLIVTSIIPRQNIVQQLP